ncbi:MAG: glycosyltransferase family 2 protein [Magnetococcales bacterium]|nr:glycosyltransferase family 2 protein [Magnetococcales bacterium]
MTVARVKTLTIVIPCYNESKTLVSLAKRVLAADTLGLARDIIIVDDGSRDDSRELARDLARHHPAEIRLICHEYNQGKGAALRTGFQAATGEVVLVQDADLEYDPTEYPRLLGPILDGVADVVYGSRFRGGEAGRVLYFWHAVGNRFLTLLSNIFTNLNLTDMETCFKVFRREVLARIHIAENRFGFEPEITAKVAKLGSTVRIYEVGISYYGRSYADGKKITWKDGVRAIYCIVRYNLFS